MAEAAFEDANRVMRRIIAETSGVVQNNLYVAQYVFGLYRTLA